MLGQDNYDNYLTKMVLRQSAPIILYETFVSSKISPFSYKGSSMSGRKPLLGITFSENVRILWELKNDLGLSLRETAEKVRIPFQNIDRWFKKPSILEGKYTGTLDVFIKKWVRSKRMRGPLKLLKRKLDGLFSDSEQEWLELFIRERKSIEGESIKEVVIRTIPTVERVADSETFNYWHPHNQKFLIGNVDRVQCAAVFLAKGNSSENLKYKSQRGNLTE